MLAACSDPGFFCPVAVATGPMTSSPRCRFFFLVNGMPGELPEIVFSFSYPLREDAF